MFLRSLILAVAVFGTEAAHGQPVWVKQNAWEQVQQSQMQMMMGRGAPLDKDGLESGPIPLTVYTPGKTYRGLGYFRLQEGSRMRGTQESRYIRMDGMNFFPEVTDSIECFGETARKGGNGWLFTVLSGKITAYSPMPAGPTTHYSIDDGPIREMKNDEVSQTLRAVPIASIFIDIDRDYALRLFNQYHGIDAYDPKSGPGLTELRQALFYNGGSWASEKEMPGDGLSVRLAKARYACQNRRYDEGLGAVGQLEEKFPDLYLSYSIEGECYEKQKNLKAAIEAYVQARTHAPDNLRLVDKLSESVSRLRWEMRGK